MSLRQLSYEALQDLDPAVIASFNATLRSLIQDCDQRPADSAWRKVTLTVSLRPVQASGGELDALSSHLAVKGTTPEVRSRDYTLAHRVGGMAVFNPDSPDNPNQATLLGEDD